MTTSLKTRDSHRPVTVLKVGSSVVDVDLNHPMAGKTLHFGVEITDVREATPGRTRPRPCARARRARALKFPKPIPQKDERPGFTRAFPDSPYDSGQAATLPTSVSFGRAVTAGCDGCAMAASRLP